MPCNEGTPGMSRKGRSAERSDLDDVCEDEVCPVSSIVIPICSGNGCWVLPHELAELLCDAELHPHHALT